MFVVALVAVVLAAWMSARARPRAHPRRPHGDRLLVGTAMVTIALAAALGVVRFIGGNPHLEGGVEGLLSALAFATVLATPALLALLARHDRPALLVPAGIGLILLSTVAMSGATLPLLVPGFLLLAAYGRRADDGAGTRSWAPVGIVNLVVLTGLAAAVVALFLLHDDPRSYTTAAGSGGTSDVVTWWESLSGLSLVALALTAGWCLAAPRPVRLSQRSP